jgi:hypothetical protein
MAFAFVRNLRTSSGANLKHFAQIQSAEAHAKRQDLTSQNRQDEGRSHEANYFWSKVGEGLDGGGADYAAAFREHKRQAGVKSERKGAAIGQHLLVGVSPEWLAKTGDPRDLSNARVKAVIEQAKAWAESWMGEGAVWAVRYDTDEKGAGVVDILASPVREGRAGRGKPKPQISINKAKTELQEQVGTRNSYEAMQTHWAEWAQKTLDPALQRGKPKEETRREHLYPEEFKEVLNAAKDFGEFEAKAQEMARDLEQQRRASERDRTEAERARNAAREAERQARENQRAAEERAQDAKRSLEVARAEIEAAKQELAALEPQQVELARVKTEVAEQRSVLADLKVQAKEFIEQTKAEATAAARFITDNWPAFEKVSDPVKQAMNNVLGLREAIAETLRDLGIANQRPDLGEKGPDGDPPPVLELVMTRADRKAQRKNELTAQKTPGMGQ